MLVSQLREGGTEKAAGSQTRNTHGPVESILLPYLDPTSKHTRVAGAQGCQPNRTPAWLVPARAEAQEVPGTGPIPPCATR
jgi:hypothetical protein